MVENVHDRAENILYILYAVWEHCEEIAVRIDELAPEGERSPASDTRKPPCLIGVCLTDRSSGGTSGVRNAKPVSASS